MMINESLLPFGVTELVKSKAWHTATPEQRRKFISAGVTFDTVINHYADKYRTKKTLKGEFIACVLWDFYYDCLEHQLKVVASIMNWSIGMTVKMKRHLLITTAKDYWMKRLTQNVGLKY